MKKKAIQHNIKNPHGGSGDIELNELLGPDDTMENVSLLAHVKVAPYTDIGYHQHIKEAEIYYVLKGEGFFINNSKKYIPIKTGDICSIKVGGGHGLVNPNKEVMEIIALVYPERNVN